MQTKKISIVLEFPKPSKVFNKHIYNLLDDYSKFTEIHYGGASSGKSHGVVQKVVIKACKTWKKPRKVLFLRKVGRSIRDSILGRRDGLFIIFWAYRSLQNKYDRLPHHVTQRCGIFI